MCNCTGCRPKSSRARANAAIRMLLRNRYLSRCFEHAFEMPDADAVVREVTRRAKADPALAAVIRQKGYGQWLDPTQYAWLWTDEPHPFSDAANNPVAAEFSRMMSEIEAGQAAFNESILSAVPKKAGGL